VTANQSSQVDHPLHILVIDDDSGDRKHVRRSLERGGLSVLCVEETCVEDAIVLCAERKFDCVFIDYRLPGRDGVDGVTALKECAPRVPIIMITGQGDEIVATEAMKRGASDYMVKSLINSESITRCTRGVLERAGLQNKLAAQRAELESFADMLVHDLSAPIAALQVFAQSIGSELSLESFDKREIAGHCAEVVTAGNRITALIDALFQFTRADVNCEAEPVAMDQVLDDALSNLRNVIQQRHAHVSREKLPVVLGNAPQLVLLLQNLIGNALKYCEADPPCVFITSKLLDERTWLFAVRDNGIGIPAEQWLNVFQPFKRLHGASEYEGSGLGLATCKKIVECHGGSIYCESFEGGGATFFFSLQRVDK
jgi:signal transduction histidine kinase